jgi:hypothetical protein
MMGRQEHDLGCLFYQFDPEEMVPSDHLPRGVAYFLDLNGLREIDLTLERIVLLPQKFAGAAAPAQATNLRIGPGAQVIVP